MNSYRLVVPAFGAVALLATQAAAVPAKTIEYVVTNATGMTANDLELDFLDEGITMGNSRSFRNAATAPTDTSSITFTSGMVANGGQDTGTVTFGPRGPYTLANAFWTFSNAQPIRISLPTVTIDGGRKLSMASPTGLEGYMVLDNTDSQTIYISNFDAATDIPEADYVPSDPTFENDLDIPAGIPAAGLPTSFALAPGQELDLDLGPVDSTDYEAMQFNLSYSPTTPGNTLGLASDVTVPEPASLTLLATALGGAWLACRRKSTRSAPDGRSERQAPRT